MRKSKTKEVLIGAIARKLCSDTWFDKFEFSQKTGIGLDCCNPRLRVLVKSGYLTTKHGKGRRLMYLMSKEQKEAMAEKGRSDKLMRGLLGKGDKSLAKQAAENAKALHDKAWEYLHHIKFV